MFTPQRAPFPATDRKGKAVAFADEITTPSPPKGLRREDDGRFGAALGSAVDDWRKFKENGLLDEASLDRDALLETILKLEKELFDYQHNMGLLLIEKKKWTSTNEELQQAFDEANEIIKRGRTSNLIALNEAEKREENLRKALISEKQFAAELERDLKYLQQEHSEVKSTMEAKLAEANALVMGIKDNSLEVDRKRAIAEEKLSVINRKSSELERKLKEVETREKVLQREHLSLVTEREAHEAVFYKQREDLQEWEKKLTVEEDRLSEAKRSINHIEEKTIESEKTIKKKEKILEETQQKIDIAKSELKEREESINSMLNDISMKEKVFEAMKTKVDMKENELHELEEKLIVREQMEIGKLLDDQKAVLDSRKHEFEMELEQMRISLDEELERKKSEVEQLEVEISHKREKLTKKEAASEKMDERVKEKEKEFESRQEVVKENEKALKTEEKKLHIEKKRLLEDKESLRKLKDEIEEIGAKTTKQESRIREEHESLRITKEERLEFLMMQSELKQQIDRVKQEEELLWKEREELKKDKGRFEKEWKALDEKKADKTREQKEITEEKEKLRSLQISEKHRLKREEIILRDNLKREVDDVKMQKESFEAGMEIKKLALHENAKNKTSQLVEDLETQRRNLDMELQRHDEEGGKDFNERARTYEKRGQEELNDNISWIKKLAQREMEEVQYEYLALNRERGEISVKRKTLYKQTVELYKDVDEVKALRISLKEQREQVWCAQERFLLFLKEIKLCDSCGEFHNHVQSNRTLDVENGDKLSENSKSTSLIGTLAAIELPESSQPDDTLDTVAGNEHESSGTEQSFAESKIQEGPEVSLRTEIKKLALHENAKNKTTQLVEDLETQRRYLDMELQRHDEEGGKDFNERAKTYEKRGQEELNDTISYIKKPAQREMEDLQFEKIALKGEREDISVKRKTLYKQSVEIFKGVDQIEALRIYLKEQREIVCCEKERFLLVLNQIMFCNSCGEKFHKFVQSNRAPDVENGDKLPENSKSASLIGILAAIKLPESLQPDDTLDTVAGNDHEASGTEQSFAESKIQEGPEVSLQSEIKSDKPRRGRGRSKSVRGRPQATKAASRDSKPSDREIPRKRQREHVSRITEGEHAAGDSDEGVDSITTGGRRKKRQTAIPVSLTSGQSRYHLRRHRNLGTEEDKAQASTGGMEKQESVNDDIRTVPSLKDNLTPPQGENRENGKAEILVEAVTHEEIVKVEAETELKDKNTGKRPVEDPQFEVGGSGERKEDDGNVSMMEEENEGEEEEETECQGEASIGKKIWVFFTT